MAPSLEPIEGIASLADFKTLLETNPGLLFIKFGAEWCAPCQKIRPHIESWFERLPDHAQIVEVDIDESLEVYAFLKNKKMLNGVPTVLLYRQGNTNYPPDDAVSGADPKAVDQFFNRALGLYASPPGERFSMAI